LVKALPEEQLAFMLKSENDRMNLWVHALECIGDDLADPNSLIQMATDVAVDRLLTMLEASPGNIRTPLEIMQWYQKVLEEAGLSQANNVIFSRIEAGRIRMEVGQGCPYALTCQMRTKKKRLCKRVSTFISLIRQRLAREFDYILIEADPSLKCSCELFPTAKPRPQLFTKAQVVNLLRIFSDEMERLQEGSVEKAGRSYAQRLNGDLKTCLEQFATAGLGKIELEDGTQKNRQAVFKGSNLLQGIDTNSSRAVDEFTRGFLAGVVSRLSGVEVNCEEIECVAKGDTSCRFAVTSTRSTEQINLTQLKTVTVRLGYLPSMDHLTLPVANEIMIPNNSLIKLELKEFTFWRDLNQAVAEGQLDGGFMTVPMLLSYRQQGLPLKAVCLGHRNGSSFVVGPYFEELQNSSEAKPRQVLIAIPNKLGMETLLLKKWMIQMGLSFRTVSIPSANMIFNLANTEIDGYLCSEPFASLAEREKVGKILVSSKDIWPNHMGCVMVVNQGFYNRHPEVLNELGRQIEIAGSFIENDRLWASKIAAQYFNLLEETAHNCLLGDKEKILYTNLKLDVEELEEIQNWLVNMGLITSKLPISDLIINRS